jgi:demethylmenaquinone methyltransferase/2-methoxy-6-polyprenyl-1,4-benzoquinol methylase
VAFLLGDAYHLPSDIGVFDATFAGFWLSPVPRSRQREFLLQLGERVQPGSPVILFDNLYVEGSSTAIAESDAEGNTYQLRAPGNGAVHRVLRNFPTDLELLTLAGSIREDAQFTRWRHYWGLAYVTPIGRRRGELVNDRLRLGLLAGAAVESGSRVGMAAGALISFGYVRGWRRF